MSEKLLAEIKFRTTIDNKEVWAGLADKLGMEGGVSEFVRIAAIEKAERYLAEYLALHTIFGNSSKSGKDSRGEQCAPDGNFIGVKE
jgi:hypothetical protein